MEDKIRKFINRILKYSNNYPQVENYRDMQKDLEDLEM